MKKTMNESNPNINQIRQLRQRHLRVPYDRDLVLRLEDGRLLTGRAKDISSSGFLLITGMHNGTQELTGTRAALLVELDVEKFELPCQIVRVDKNCFAASFIKQE
ncbi:MAG: PilZ domain-containing protein [Magnetococcales bacterium]|nr:PilZ domain-containing protein [Magnetococcales bacterium]